MKKKLKLQVSSQSIYVRTLIYFMIMALSMITLLWAVQEWFFSTQYAGLKQKEIVKTLNKSTSGATRPLDPEFFNGLYQVAQEANLKIYCLVVKKTSSNDANVEKYTHSGETLFRLKGQFVEERIISPVVARNDIYVDTSSDKNDLNWTAEQENRFISMLNLQQISNKILSESMYDKKTGQLFFATRASAEGYYGQMTYVYFYAEGVVAGGDYTLDVMRFLFVLIAFLCLLLAFVFSLVLGVILAKPITNISKKAGCLAKGNYDVEFGKSSIKEINKLTQTLDFAKNEFSQTESMRKEFLANISHDLRTPLTMVKAYAEMIRDLPSSNPEKRKKHANVIIDEADRLSLLVADIQNLSKIQSGQDAINRTEFDLNQLCASTVGQFSVMHEKFGYSIIYDSKGECIVNADREKIAQVLYNLIGNAINYSNKESKLINIRLIKNDREALVEIEDNGKGIAEEDLDAVWDRYYRANQIKRSVVGSGLGLSIVKNILVAHKATYGVTSELDKGTIFWFLLPIADKKSKQSQNK